MTCSNCGAKLSCGCQKRVASNGASVCTTCQISYEALLGRQSTPSTPTSPSNINVKYNPPGKR
jgi:hypothetical protein